MASLLPGQLTLPISLEIEGNALEYDILAEKASALGRAGERAERMLTRLSEHGGDPGTRGRLVKEAAKAVHAYFIQRELCGFAAMTRSSANMRSRGRCSSGWAPRDRPARR